MKVQRFQKFKTSPTVVTLNGVTAWRWDQECAVDLALVASTRKVDYCRTDISLLSGIEFALNADFDQFNRDWFAVRGALS